MSQKITFCLGIFLLLNFVSCSNGGPEVPAKTTKKAHDIEGVSVWDRISARSQPSRNSPRASLLSLGERFLYLDTFAIDSSNNNTKFLKVRLSDSTEVWVYDFASVLDAKPAVIITEVPLYLRPDLLTISDTRMQVMEIVAVVEEWDDWIKVVNEKKDNRGWIKSEYLSYNTIDLAFALLVKRSMETEDQEQKIQNMEDLLNRNPYPNTIFISELKAMVEKEKDILNEREFKRRDEEKERQKRNR